uniref:Leucine-rich repeat-containing N-terminal plant-type domain-containing protein n=1 Tax=Cucumis melo TaxID=3656 RepID=A0A9I9CEH2_CUCME
MDKHYFITRYVSFVWLLCVILLSTAIVGAYTSNNCSDIEREALISFKQGLLDPSARLSSWVGHNCCQWHGITCNPISGKVIKIDLHNSLGSALSQFVEYGDLKRPWIDLKYFLREFQKTCLTGKISHSLLELKYLYYLDLSFNDFEGASIPYFLGMLKSLRYLKLSSANFSGQIPIYLRNLTNLSYLDLSDERGFMLHVKNLRWLSGFSSLEYLNLGGVNLISVERNWMHTINGLSSLLELHLSNCGILSFDTSIAFLNLTSLRVLDLSSNLINSSIPLWLSNLTSLSTLDLNGNIFRGTIPSNFVKLKNLQVLELTGNSLSNDIGDHTPPIFSQNLCKLRFLHLGYNHYDFKLGTFLDSFSNCSRNRLESLDLVGNKIVGEIPNSLGTFKNLRFLNLSDNFLWGSLPNSIGNLSLLEHLHVSSNVLNGTIPLSFGQLSKLVYYEDYGNSWNTTITEVHLMNLTELKILQVWTKSIQTFVFNITYDWIPPFSLKILFLENCLIRSQFPIWLRTQTQLTEIVLSNVGIFGSLPNEWISKVSSQVIRLDLSYNLFNLKLSHIFTSHQKNDSGENDSIIPLRYPNLRHLDLRNNQLLGTIPLTINDSMPNLYRLDLSENNLHGTIPSSIKTMNHLEVLSMSHNRLSGKLFDDWSRLKSLLVVDLANNNLHGKIPTTIGLLTSLNKLMLNNNNLHGEIPNSLQNCSLLTSLDLSENIFLTGNLPSWLGVAVPKLQLLNLRSNHFSGTIPRQWCNLSAICVLDLSNNHLDGKLPNCLHNWKFFVQDYYRDGLRSYQTNSGAYYSYDENTRLVMKGMESEYNTILDSVLTIDLSRNKLTGEIPKEITNLVQLDTLNLSNNNFVGIIPENIGAMKKLETLDLSYNNLSGRIPASLASLNFLTHLNMSFNNLTGKIPIGNQLQTLEDPSIYEGNPSLCGPPLQIKCAGDESSNNVLVSTSEEEKEDGNENDLEMVGFYISMAIGFPVGINILFFTIFTNEARRIFYFGFVDDVNYKILQIIDFLIVGVRRMMRWR